MNSKSIVNRTGGSGRKIAITAQIALLVVYALSLIPAIIMRTDELDLLSPMLPLLGFSTLPIVVVLVGLLMNQRWPFWVALGVLICQLLTWLLTFFPNTGVAPTLSLILWLLTVGALIPGANKSGKTSDDSFPKLRFLIPVLGVAIGVTLFVLPLGFTVYQLSDATGLSGGTAPEGSFATRRSWGEQIYGPYLKYIDAWVEKSPAITRDTGKVLSIAPISSPNFYQGCFTDGCYAAMNLEIKGEKGSGVLYLPYISVSDSSKQPYIDSDSSWEFSGNRHLILKNGQSYLVQLGIESVYEAIMTEDNSQSTLKKYDQFRELLKYAEQPRGFRVPHHKHSIAKTLHWFYREPLLIRLAQAWAEQHKPDEAISAYNELAETALDRAHNLLLGDAQRRDGKKEGEALDRANSALKNAHTLDPEDDRTLRQARRRVELQHLFTADVIMAKSNKNRDREQLTRQTLGLFYREAKSYARESPYLKRRLGTFSSIDLAPYAISNIAVTKSNHYSAGIFLRVTSFKGEGVLLVSLRENQKLVPAIDLFAPQPRAPQYPIKIYQSSWEPEKGERVRLSGKTGDTK